MFCSVSPNFYFIMVDKITIGREKFPILQEQREVLETISENDNVWFRLDRRVGFSSAMVDYANTMADVGHPVYYFVDSEHTLKHIHDIEQQTPKTFIHNKIGVEDASSSDSHRKRLNRKLF